MLRDLIQRGVWNADMRIQLIAHNGSVQDLEMPSDLKELYKTVWEIKQRTVLDMAAAHWIYVATSTMRCLISQTVLSNSFKFEGISKFCTLPL